MSFAYGPADETESLRVLRRYLELGEIFWILPRSTVPTLTKNY